MSKQDFVQGLGNIFAAQDYMDDIVAMQMDDKEQVTVYFRGGGYQESQLCYGQ